MNTTGLKILSEYEMSQIKGGTGQWYWDGEQWVWIEGFSLGGNDESVSPSPNTLSDERVNHFA